MNDNASSNKETLIFLLPYNDILKMFLVELAKGFEKIGFRCLYLDPQKKAEALNIILGAISQKPAAVFAFNHLGLGLSLSGNTSIWETLDIPCVDILTDHPYHLYQDFDILPPKTAIICVDKNHLGFLSRFYPGFPVTGFLPHGGLNPEGQIKPLTDRNIDVLYAGGLAVDFADNYVPDVSIFDFDAISIGDRTLDLMIACPQKTFEGAIEEILMEDSIFLSDEILKELIIRMRHIDTKAVVYFREKAVSAVAKRKIGLTLYGSGWENMPWYSSLNVTHKKNISPYELSKVMMDSKIVLNTMTWFKDGSNERIYNAQLAGALAISDTSLYLKETQKGYVGNDDKDERNMVFYEIDKPDFLPDIIDFMLDNPDSSQKIADRGRFSALENNTWEIRSRELFDELFPVLKML